MFTSTHVYIDTCMLTCIHQGMKSIGKIRYCSMTSNWSCLVVCLAKLSCYGDQGQCKASCLSKETEIHGGCGSRCKCCLPPPSCEFVVWICYQFVLYRSLYLPGVIYTGAGGYSSPLKTSSVLKFTFIIVSIKGRK